MNTQVLNPSDSGARRAVAFALFVWTCSGLAPSVFALEVTIRPDLVTGHKDGLAMTLDVLTPNGNINGAAILYMVSGGWVSRWSPPEER